MKGDKLILAGDPLQLPPTVLSVNKKLKKGTGTKAPVVTAPKSKCVLTVILSQNKPELSLRARPVVKEPPPSSSGSSDDESDSSAEAEPPTKTSPIPKKGLPKRKKTDLRPPKSLEVTLFERLEKTHGASIKRMLQVQYR